MNLIDVGVGRVVVVGRVAPEALLFIHGLVQGIQDLEGKPAGIDVLGEDGITVKEELSEIFAWKKSKACS